MSATSGKMKYNSIQVLRCVAVMAVLILHSNFSIEQGVYQVPFFSQFGWIGVRLFFVISGFIIAERIAFERSLGAFLFRRYMRVLPLYALITMVALLVSVAVGRGIFGTSRTDSGGVYDPEPVAYFLKSLFIVPQDPWPAFMVGWSLEYEVVFYFSFGIAYFLGGRGGALATMLAMSVAGVVFPDLTLMPAGSFGRRSQTDPPAGVCCRSIPAPGRSRRRAGSPPVRRSRRPRRRP